MPDTVNPQITDATTAPGPGLRPAVVAALSRAMENAVSAQQQLNQVGIAALTQALAVRLSTPDARSASSASAASATSTTTRAAAAAADTAAAAALRASVQKAAGTPPGPPSAVAWSRAFAKGMALIDAATAQHARDLVLTVMMAQANPETQLTPGEAMLLTNLFTGNALAQAILDLSAAKSATAAAR
jgi:hypothetical protein